MTTPDIVFLDTETTSLRYDRQVWEIGIIKRTHNENGSIKSESEHQYIIKDVDLSNADTISLGIGKFHERFSKNHISARPEFLVAEEIFRLMKGCHVVGAVPGFDDEALKMMLRRHGLIDTWHYHLMDVENLAVGYLRGLQFVKENITGSDYEVANLPSIVFDEYDCSPPWSSEELSNLIGIEPASDEERHTALGDAKWAMRVYDRVIGIA